MANTEFVWHAEVLLVARRAVHPTITFHFIISAIALRPAARAISRAFWRLLLRSPAPDHLLIDERSSHLLEYEKCHLAKHFTPPLAPPRIVVKPRLRHEGRGTLSEQPIQGSHSNNGADAVALEN